MQADGSYTYVRNAGTPGGVTDTFSYTLKDGDSDTSVTTLTISIGDDTPTVTVPVAGQHQGRRSRPAGRHSQRDDGSSGNNAIAPSETTSGTINYFQGDGPATAHQLGATTINAASAATWVSPSWAFGTLTSRASPPRPSAIPTP